MKVSLSWLKEYVPVKMEVSELAEGLTMAGLEVESITDRYAWLDSVKVGRIIKVNPHPDADMLKLCTVDIGSSKVSVVCGAPNAREGILSPLALPKTVLPDGRVLESAVIRGQRSEGMLCSAAELEIGSEKETIMELSGASVGDGLAAVLGLSDYVLEVSLTPNRPDCLSIIGIAKEIAAIFNVQIRLPDFHVQDSCLGADKILQFTSVKIEAPDHCPRYSARLLEGVTVSQSPFWLQDRLMSVGIRPINNIVDITNFVLMEIGQPLHAFDFDMLEENRIVVRLATPGERFTTLDGKERALSSDMLMICDGKKPVAVGGVMGGLNSEISDKTRRVLIESAYFEPVSIRKTSKRLGLSTEASFRFERGIDPEGTVNALNRSAMMMKELGGGSIISGLIDERTPPFGGAGGERKLSLSVNATNQMICSDLTAQEIEGILKSLSFDVHQEDDDTLNVIPPSFRVDVKRSVDLIEEVARLWGYDNVPTTLPMMPARRREPLRQYAVRRQLKRCMNSLGFTEAITYSFIHKDMCDRLRLNEKDARRNIVRVLNPLSEDQAVMRTSLIYSLIDTMRHNIAWQVKNLKIFEIGNIFIAKGEDTLPDEKEMLAGLWSGSRYDASWHFKETPCDFYDIKGAVESLLKGLNINAVFTRMPDAECCYTKPGHTASIQIKQSGVSYFLGIVGEVHPEVLRTFDLKQTAFIFELDVNALINALPDSKHAAPIPKYPAISRDFTLIVESDIESITILENVRSFDESLIEDLYIFDVYEGEKIPKGKKSISFRMIYRSRDKTLEDEAVNILHKDIADRLVKRFNAMLPV